MLFAALASVVIATCFDGDTCTTTTGERVRLACIDAPEETWLWQGVLLKADSNMLISLPKVRKTTLLIAMIAAWWNGAQSHLGQPLVGTCPPVVSLVQTCLASAG